MTDSCCSRREAGSEVCDLPLVTGLRTSLSVGACPVCGQLGKPVQGQTVRALLARTLRAMQDGDYLFCQRQTCPVVYFAASGQTFTVDQVREQVYQKVPEAERAPVCYCFQHTVGELRAASPEQRKAIVEDINTGIRAGQCACDLRNPQGFCCLGNVRALIQRLDIPATETE